MGMPEQETQPLLRSQFLRKFVDDFTQDMVRRLPMPYADASIAVQLKQAQGTFALAAEVAQLRETLERYLEKK